MHSLKNWTKIALFLSRFLDIFVLEENGFVLLCIKNTGRYDFLYPGRRRFDTVHGGTINHFLPQIPHTTGLCVNRIHPKN